MPEEEVPVLIVGGSLVGLTTAMLLGRQRVPSLSVERHAGTAIVNVGLAERNSHFFTRVVQLAADPKGHTLKPFRRGSVAPRRSPAAVGS